MAQTTAQVLAAVISWWLHMAQVMEKMHILMLLVIAIQRRRSLNNDPTVVYSEQPSTNQTATSSASRKRRRNNGDDGLVDAIRVGFEGMESAFKEMTMELASQVRRVAPKSNMADMKTQLWEKVSKVPGFTEDELATAAIEIGNNETLLVMFPTLPDAVKHKIIRDFNK